MNISKDGRVIVVDDKPKEVEPLLNIFSKLGIPYLFYTGELEYLPQNSVDLSPRFIFLDLNLTMMTSSAQKNDKAILYAVLNRILIKENVPYALIIWSKSDSRLRTILDELFLNELSAKQPLIKIDLEKSDFFILNTEGSWDLKDTIEKTVEKLQVKINKKFNELDAIEFILSLENISYDSISEVTNMLYNLTFTDKDRNKTLKEIYYKVAEAYWGKQIQLDSYAKAAAIVLNNIFSDRNEINLFENISLGLLKLKDRPSYFDDKKLAALNTQLLISKSFLDKVLPGCIYASDKPDILKSILRNAVDRNSLIKNYCTDKVKIESDILDENGRIKKESKGDFYKYVDEEKLPEIEARLRFIEIEISPLCDYSQNKQINYKTLCGFILSADDIKHIKNKADFLYKTPKLEIDSKICYIILDLRFVNSPPIKTFNSTAIIRLRQTILNEIQFRLSQYLCRIGVTYIEDR